MVSCRSFFVRARRYFVRGSASYEHFAPKAFELFQNRFLDQGHDEFDPTTAIGMIEKHRRDVLKLKATVSVLLFVDDFHLLREECRTVGAGNQGCRFDVQDHSVMSNLCNTVEQANKHTVMISTLENTALVRGALTCRSLSISYFSWYHNSLSVRVAINIL
jgi:hypothetical protein